LTLTNEQLWHRFRKYFAEFPSLDLAIDRRRMNFPDGYFDRMEPRMHRAFAAMTDLERGAIANPDGNRRVGHYWLWDPALTPAAEIRQEIERTVDAVKSFAADLHDGCLNGAGGESALGLQFVSFKSYGAFHNRQNGCLLNETASDVGLGRRQGT